MAAPAWLGVVTPQMFPRLVTSLADQQYPNHAREAWMAEHRAGGRIAVHLRPVGTRGFPPREQRWVMERTNAWPGRYRRHSKDDERRGESRAAMIQIRHRPLMLNRLSPCGRPAFYYREEAA